MFDGTSEVIIQALRLHRHEVFSDCDIDEALKTVKETDININDLYEKRIKFLYSDILKYSILAQKNMNKEQRRKVYKIQLASRDMIEAIKDIRELQKNIAGYMVRGNENIKNEYNFLRKGIAQLLRIIAGLKANPGDLERVTDLETAKKQNKGLDIITAKRLSVLLREGKITESMASSLLNDGTYTSQIAKKLIKSADILWGKSTENDADSLKDSLLQPQH